MFRIVAPRGGYASHSGVKSSSARGIKGWQQGVVSMGGVNRFSVWGVVCCGLLWGGMGAAGGLLFSPKAAPPLPLKQPCSHCPR